MPHAAPYHRRAQRAGAPARAMTPLDLAVILAALILGLDLLARQLKTPRPIVLATSGVGIGVLAHFIPGLPHVALQPRLILGLVLPPLLAGAAFRVSLSAFRASLRPIAFLAIGLVFATTAGVAAVAHAVVPGLPWAAALVLGALVAPPDSVAATTLAGSVGLRNRLVTILEGEGLVNDATALVAYQLAVQAAVTGEFSWGHAATTLLLSAPAGVLVGLAVGWATAQIRRRVDDSLLESAMSLLAPYVAYVLAEHLHSSAVLAVVAFGMYIRQRATEIGSPPTRLVNRTVWQVMDFITGGLVFVLVGLEVGEAATAIFSAATLGRAAAVVGATIGIRLAWMYVVPHLDRLRHPAAKSDVPSWRELTVLGWAGMRGVVSLALALAIPAQTASGMPLPGREDVVILALAVVLATLIGQGLTLGPLIRRLGIADPGAPAREEAAAREAAIRAARAQLDALAAQGALRLDQLEHLEHKLEHGLGVRPDHRAKQPGDGTAALLQALTAERETIRQWWNEGRLNEDSALRLEAELDLAEMSARGISGRILGS
ncbi:MAG TPA: Na+/H+ antiporter [Gemmatimonadales bacterium]|nr:Na+/H+ antiporter [Gemmatimonadales bacterium]